MKGSIMLALAESKEEVVKALQEGIYFKSNVWDWDKVSIAFRNTTAMYRGFRLIALKGSNLSGTLRCRALPFLDAVKFLTRSSSGPPYARPFDAAISVHAEPLHQLCRIRF